MNGCIENGKKVYRVLLWIQGGVVAYDAVEKAITAAINSATTGEKNALKKAENYLRNMAFSYKGLIEQLEFDGFTTEEATYGVDNCGADWMEQVAKRAKSYLDHMAFSRSSLIEQLMFEGFTEEQAVYGAEQNGY